MDPQKVKEMTTGAKGWKGCSVPPPQIAPWLLPGLLVTYILQVDRKAILA